MKNHVEYYKNYELEHKEWFKKKSDEDLINSFNGGRNAGWCHAKMIYHHLLQEELEKRFDTSNIIVNGNYSYAKKIYLNKKKVYIKKSL